MQVLDRQTLTDLFAAHGDAMVLFARQLLPLADRSDAQDVVQELFVKLLAMTAEGDGIAMPANRSTWLFACVRNACLDQQRSASRRRRRERSAQGASWFETRADDLLDAKSAESALALLPDSLREVLVLRIWSGLTLAEVSEVVGRPVSTIHDQYRQSLGMVRKYLEGKSADAPSRS